MHEDNQYHSPYVLEFWEYKHPMMVSELWEGNIEKDNQDPVQTYKRLNNLTQEQFNDEMFEEYVVLLLGTFLILKKRMRSILTSTNIS